MSVPQYDSILGAQVRGRALWELHMYHTENALERRAVKTTREFIYTYMGGYADQNTTEIYLNIKVVPFGTSK